MNIYELTTSQVKNGWMLPEKCEWFEKIYFEIKNTHKAKIIAVETGVFYGMSCIAQGLIGKFNFLDFKIYGIDAWSKEASVEGNNSEANNKWWEELDYNDALRSFLISIQYFGLQGKVIPILGKSEDVKHYIPDQIQIFHSDGNHSFDVVSKEIEIYAPRITKGGYWIADDSKWKEMKDAPSKLVDYNFTLVHEHFKDGQSFSIYKKY